MTTKPVQETLKDRSGAKMHPKSCTEAQASAVSKGLQSDYWPNDNSQPSVIKR